MLSFTSFWFLCLYSLITQSGIDTLKTKGLIFKYSSFLRVCNQDSILNIL